MNWVLKLTGKEGMNTFTYICESLQVGKEREQKSDCDKYAKQVNICR